MTSRCDYHIDQLMSNPQRKPVDLCSANGFCIWHGPCKLQGQPRALRPWDFAMHHHVHTPSQAQPGTVADLAATRPHSVAVLQRYGIDFCCGGGRPLDQACAVAAVSVAQLLAEVAEREAFGKDERRWDQAPLPELVAYIVDHHHQPLADELTRLQAMAARVLKVHGPKDPERLAELYETVLALETDLIPHLRKEEDVLFPLIIAGRPLDAGEAVQALRLEHDGVATLLTRARELTDHYVPPDHACMTWRALFNGLSELEVDLKRHIHLENNILFPRALMA